MSTPGNDANPTTSQRQDPHSTTSNQQNQNRNHRRRGQKSRTKHDEEFRERVGMSFEEERRNAILKRLHADEFEMMAIISPSSSVATFSSPVPITTRALGLISNETIESIKRVFMPEKVMQAGNVYQLFLGSLAQLYLQMECSERRSELGFRRCYSRPVEGLASQCDQLIRSNSANFRPLISLIETVGTTKYLEKNYHPIIPEPEVSDREFMPNPFFTNFSNLRQTLVYLSNRNTDIGVRRYFMQYNALPGSLWDIDSAVLLNPERYYAEYPRAITSRSLREAFNGIKSLLMLTKSKMPHLSQLNGDSPRCSFSGLGDPAMLVSVSLDDGPRLEDVVVVGPEHESFYSSVPLTSQILIRGSAYRLGEFQSQNPYGLIPALLPQIVAQRNPYEACCSIDIQWQALVDKILE